MDTYSYIGNADVTAIENLYQQYQHDPNSVDREWQKFFTGFDFAQKTYGSSSGSSTAPVPEQFRKEINAINLIGAYRQRGHLFSKTNPVRPRRDLGDPITLANFDLSESDLDTVFQAGTQIGTKQPMKLRDIIDCMEQTYCRAVGVELY